MATSRDPLTDPAPRRLRWILLAVGVLGAPRAGAGQDAAGVPPASRPYPAYADVSGRSDPRGPSSGETDWIRRWQGSSEGRRPSASGRPGAEGAGAGGGEAGGSDSSGPSAANS